VNDCVGKWEAINSREQRREVSECRVRFRNEELVGSLEPKEQGVATSKFPCMQAFELLRDEFNFCICCSLAE
jgi:hypothetical protein